MDAKNNALLQKLSIKKSADTILDKNRKRITQIILDSFQNLDPQILIDINILNKMPKDSDFIIAGTSFSFFDIMPELDFMQQCKCTIDIVKNPIKIGTKVYKGFPKERYESFFESFDLDFNEQSMFIFLLLHELGHIYHYSFHKSVFGSFEDLNNFYNYDKNNFFNIILTKNFSTLSELRLGFYYSAMEAFAESFAYRNFPICYRILKESEINVLLSKG